MTPARILQVLLLCLPPSCLLAETAEQQGLAIAREADLRDSGYVAYTNDVKMILRNKHGRESIREIRSKTLEVENDGDKSLTVFDRPRDVKGTALLSFTHKEGPDDQWLYLPALKRVKRIASDNKSGPFMGSEFAYEDITSQEVEKYTYKFIRTIPSTTWKCLYSNVTRWIKSPAIPGRLSGWTRTTTRNARSSSMTAKTHC